MAISSEVWSIIGTATGGILGWASTQLNTWYTGQQTDKRTLRECLYPLLDLYNQLSKVRDIEKEGKLVLQRIGNRFPQLTELPEWQQAHESLLKMIRPILLSRVSRDIQQLQEIYNTSLLKLASVDPISAYRLRGKENVITRIGEITTTTTGYLDTLEQPENPEDAKPVYDMIHKLSQESIHATCKRAEEALMRIAYRIGRHTHKEVQDVVSRGNPESVEWQEEIDEQIEKYIAPLIHRYV